MLQLRCLARVGVPGALSASAADIAASGRTAGIRAVRAGWPMVSPPSRAMARQGMPRQLPSALRSIMAFLQGPRPSSALLLQPRPARLSGQHVGFVGSAGSC